MGDELKDAAVAVLGLALFAGFAAHRAEHAIVHDLRHTLRGGVLHADVKPHGLFGLVVGRIDGVRVTGSGLSAETVPFRVIRGPGIRADSAHLDFDLTDLTLRGTTVRRFKASFPAVSLDAGRAFFDERIILRRAGEGTASAEVTPDALARFIERKYPALKRVSVELAPGGLVLRGSVTMFGRAQAVEAAGKLSIREGRYLDIVEPDVRLDGRPSLPAFAQALARGVNPVVDLDKDLGLGAVFYAEEVEIGEGYAVVRGRAHVPPAETVRKQETKP